MDINKLKRVILKQVLLNKEVYLMAHKNIDLDAFASMAGLSLIIKKFKRKVYIVIDDKQIESATSLALEKVSSHIKIINTKEALQNKDKKSILIIMDVNKPMLTTNEEFINYFSEIIVIDHHNITKETLQVNNLFVSRNATSTCEIVTELLYKFRIKIPKNFATIILGGIALDTNNFTYKMTKKSFYYCYYLASHGADIEEAQFLLKQDLKEYVNRTKMISSTKIDEEIAIASGEKNKLYTREDLAKTADLLLSFKGIKNAFAIGNIDKKKVGVSARSLNKINAGKLMEQFGGGGNKNEAATIIEGKSIKEVEKELIEKLK